MVDPPLPLLITGISGVAGYNALVYFRALYPGQVVGLRQPDNWRMLGAGIAACDAGDAEGLARLFDQHGFRAVLNCAGNCALRSCELDPAMAQRINVDGVRVLLDVLAGRDVRLVHLSIDLVYSGDGAGGYFEHDPVDPVTEYGRTMVAAERLIAERDAGACVLRISLPMGVSFNGHAGAIDWIQSRFRQRKPATLYFDEIRTPTYTDCLNQLCGQVLASDERGVWHAGASRRLSLFQIGQVINRVGGYDPGLLLGCWRREAGPMPPRAGNVALDSSRLADRFGRETLDAWPALEEHVPRGPDWHVARDGDAGSPQLLADMLYSNPRKPGLPRPEFFRAKRRRMHV